MLSLSPVKILVVLIVALIVLGPEKLPQVARQMGAAWGDLRRLRSRLESEVRDVFPDLPPTHEVAQAVRSPLAFLDRLADEHERNTAPAGEVTADERAGPDGAASARGAPTAGTAGTVTGPGTANGSSANGTGAGGTSVSGAAAGATDLVPGMAAPGTDAASPVVPDDPSMN